MTKPSSVLGERTEDPSDSQASHLINPQTISRRDTLALLGKTSAVALLASACGIDPSLEPQAKRPNIIYMHSHDTGRYIQPYGYNVATPNLQRFANEAFLFKRAFSASPTCSPSRASLLTGMTPGCNGMWGLAHRGWKLNSYSQTLPQVLRRAGYVTALAGLQHVASGDAKTSAKQIGYDTLLQPKGLAKPVADAAVAYLKRLPKQPFFLDVGFMETHVMVRTGTSRFGYGPGDTRTAGIPNTLRDSPETRRDMAAYTVAAGVLDEAMGRVLAALEHSGQADDTLVIITTDHGLPLPGSKGNHTNAGLGVMLMMRGPGGFSGGKVNRALVSQLDIFPTVCDLLRLPVPAWVQGTSLLPLVSGKKRVINDALFSEHEAHSVPEPQASVRTERYRYIRRLDGSTGSRPENCDPTDTKALWVREGWLGRTLEPEQLYDIYEDPYEKKNLAADPRYAKLLAEMRGRLVERMNTYNNPLLHKYAVSTKPPRRRAGLNGRQSELVEIENDVAV